MEPGDRIITDITAWDWYQQRYQRCLERYGPDSVVTQGFKRVLERIDRRLIEEKTLSVHYTSDYSRPLDTSI
jgi:hypothetical protein